MQADLEKKGSTLCALYGTPETCFEKLLRQFEVKAVYTNNDYEPYATRRDREIAGLLAKQRVAFHSYKDQVIFEKSEVVKDNGEPYTVFTPYSKRWLQRFNDFPRQSYSTAEYDCQFLRHTPIPIPSLKEIGFMPADYSIVPPQLNEAIAVDYDKTRDIPSVAGTTRLSVHVRFGTISIRQLVADAQALNQTLLNELIWREFYQMILWYFPRVVTESFKKE